MRLLEAITPILDLRKSPVIFSQSKIDVTSRKFITLAEQVLLWKTFITEGFMPARRKVIHAGSVWKNGNSS